MRGIGGNVLGQLQVKSGKELNEIGELVPGWVTVQNLKGWLDFSSGESRRTTYSTKIEESTHIFVGDYVPIKKGVDSESARMLIDGETYDVLLIDNPMGINAQLEIYLKYTGGQ